MAFTTISHTNLAQVMGNESVVVYVGPERKHYLIHKNLLTVQSKFFDRAFNGNFKEAEEKSISLEEENPAAFDLLVRWLYQGRIPVIGPPFGGFQIPQIEITPPDPPGSGPILQLETTNGNTSLRRIDVLMTMEAPSEPPKNEGTSRVLYQPYPEPSFAFPLIRGPLVPIDLFRSISAQKEYRGWSHEELRAADYEEDRKFRAALAAFHLSHPDLTPAATTAVNAAVTTINAAATINHVAVGDDYGDDHWTPRVPSLSELTASDSFQPFLTHHNRSTNPGKATPFLIPGIPRSAPLDLLTTYQETHQLSLLHMCLLAETLCWDTLFNVSVSAYLYGEASLGHTFQPYQPDQHDQRSQHHRHGQRQYSQRRTLPPSHIALIYERAHADSPLRAFAAESVIWGLSYAREGEGGEGGESEEEDGDEWETEGEDDEQDTEGQDQDRDQEEEKNGEKNGEENVEKNREDNGEENGEEKEETGEDKNKAYAAIAQQYPAFLEDVFGSLGQGVARGLGVQAGGTGTGTRGKVTGGGGGGLISLLIHAGGACAAYHIHAKGESCASLRAGSGSSSGSGLDAGLDAGLDTTSASGSRFGLNSISGAASRSGLNSTSGSGSGSGSSNVARSVPVLGFGVGGMGGVADLFGSLAEMSLLQPLLQLSHGCGDGGGRNGDGGSGGREANWAGCRIA